MPLGLLPNFANTAALRYFYEVARYGSFRLAADRIHIAASAISRQIQLLERELEVKLFARDRKGLRLTAAGEALLYRVRKAINELDTARAEINRLHGSHKGTVRLGINETIAREFLPGFLVLFRTIYPQMNFEITVANSDALPAILLRGEVDIIIGYALQVRSGLQLVAAFDLKTCITVRKDHPLAKRSSVRVADLVDQNFIMPDADSMLRQVLNAMFAKVAVKPVSTITSNSFEFIATMVANGIGIGCQVCLAPGPDSVRPDILYVPIRDPAVKSAVLACYISEQGTASVAVSLCLEKLRGALEKWCSEAAVSGLREKAS